MGNGDIVVGKNPPARTPKTVLVDNPSKRAGASAPSESVPFTAKDGHCGAMSQQRCDSGATSTPQKFVRLVGCHDVKPRPQGTR